MESFSRQAGFSLFILQFLLLFTFVNLSNQIPLMGVVVTAMFISALARVAKPSPRTPAQKHYCRPFNSSRCCPIVDNSCMLPFLLTSVELTRSASSSLSLLCERVSPGTGSAKTVYPPFCPFVIFLMISSWKELFLL